MGSRNQSVPQLLQLPDACLLAVLQCCADDPRSLFSAARTHSRLHQAAVLAASSIRAVLKEGETAKERQHQTDSVQLYLNKHGQHVGSIDIAVVITNCLGFRTISLRQLPLHQPRLESLRVNCLRLQLQPGHGYQGVLHAGMPLQQLHLHGCELLDGQEGLAAALSLLPRLQHLSITECNSATAGEHAFCSNVVRGLQQLTYVEMTYCKLQDEHGFSHLTSLQDLRLVFFGEFNVYSNMLPSAQHLTRLQLHDSCDGAVHVLPAVLAGRTALQHLQVDCNIAGGSAGVTELLSHLQHLQQLTHLDFQCYLEVNAPAAAYSALTASSKLQHLGIAGCTLPEGVWKHVFPAGRQLPHLRVLHVGEVYTSPWWCWSGEWLLQLTHLQQLTRLGFSGLLDGQDCHVEFSTEGPDGEPVWHQVLRLHFLNHSDSEVAQQAAAALAKLGSNI